MVLEFLEKCGLTRFSKNMFEVQELGGIRFDLKTELPMCGLSLTVILPLKANPRNFLSMST